MVVYLIEIFVHASKFHNSAVDAISAR
jgi:hypothetical protein